MAEMSLDSKQFDDKDGGEDQARLQRQESEKKSTLQKYAENNSVGGLSYVLSSKSKIRRLIWLTIILVCVAISLYLVRNTFSKLLDPPTSTTITNDPNLSLDFPAVTICNVNAFSAEILESCGIGPEYVRLMFNANNEKFSFEPPTVEFDPLLAELTNNITENFIFRCFFGDKTCDIDKDFEFSLNELFACYTFNSGQRGKPILKVNGTGANDGLTLIVNINQNDYSATIKVDAGIKIVLHPQDEPPHPDRFGVAASPGTNMHISFKKQVYDDQTLRSCSPKGQHKWMYLSEEVSYSYASCLKDSLINSSINECGCVLSTDYLLSNQQYSLCTLNRLGCFVDNFFVNPPEPCQMACKHTTFEIISATHTTYPANYAKDLIAASNDSLIVNVYYETLNVQTQTTVYSYGIEEFFAEVGGQLGLFIGISAITFFEFVIFLLDEIKNWIKKRQRKISRS